MDKDIRNTLIDLCDFFNQLWQKVVNPEELDHMQDPPSFFDLMVHLTVHLVDEIKYYGPVFLRNMYPFERFMGILKRFCRNRNHLEASILQGYTAEDVVEF